MRRILITALVGLVVAGAVGVASLPTRAPRVAGRPPAAPADTPVGDTLDVYRGPLDARTLGALRDSGVDVHELPTTTLPTGAPGVEIVLSDSQAAALAGQGIDLTPGPAAGATVEGDGVFRPYSGPGGLKADLTALAADNPRITRLVTIGHSVRGQDIVALKVTRRAGATQDGRRPAVLYMGTQHAREWISPETVRRLAHHVVEGYGTDPTLTDLVDTTELWFVPVSNPDGYDFSFTPGNRGWRKNLRDNDGDGAVTVADGVDLNRNFPTRWGYDNEGSSPDATSEIYRGAAPASEPETRAIDRLMQRVGFEFVLNYHASSEQILYGTAWQTSTPTPDDLVYAALAGDDATSAVPGYDPDNWADQYTGGGETGEHAHETYGSLTLTPEMSACQTVSAADPADRWEPAACRAAHEFPDDEALIAAEFAKNVPFALATARSAADPDHPVSLSGRQTPEFVVDGFDVSYGDPQTVAVTARRDQRMRRLNYRINGGPVHRARVADWEGGERYGAERSVYYAEFRGEVAGTATGDSVEVWFTAGTGRNEVQSDHFTYTVAAETGADALIVASEDYTGVNPVYPAGTNAPRHAATYAAALDANGIGHATWDVDAQGVPHPLGVLSHFPVVIWETGDDRLVQDPDDVLTDTFLFGPLPEVAVAPRQHFLTMAVRDYLNEGGKLLHAGETAQYQGLLAHSLGGMFYGLDGAPDQDCVITRDFLNDCVFLADDFAQYYLGAYDRLPVDRPTGVSAGGGVLGGAAVTLGGPATVTNPLNEAGAFLLTSDSLTADEFPQFAGAGSGSYLGARNVDPVAPVEGSRYAGALPAPASYQRIGRTVDLSGVSAADAPRLAMRLSYSTLVTFHHVIVEAAPAGTGQWTTLRDLNGRTSTAPPSPCFDGILLAAHPFLRHYLTPGIPCGTTGTTGSWNAFTGDSNGWVDAAFDLSAYAGGPLDVKVSYVTDTVEGGPDNGVGVFVDDTRVIVGGTVVEADGFEAGGSAWSVEGPPPGGAPANPTDFAISTGLIDLSAAVTTEDTVLLGLGIESLATSAEQADVLGRIMAHLGA